MIRAAALTLAACGLIAAGSPGNAHDPAQGSASHPQVAGGAWQTAATPPGGTAWSLLETTAEITRTDADGLIVSRPVFPAEVTALAGRRITVAGWMLPLEAGAGQTRFVLLGYPPDCPFHFHAAPNQFIEVFAETPFPTDETTVFIVSGVLELTGEDESGVFYRLRAAHQG